jgi:hypothetical protein
MYEDAFWIERFGARGATQARTDGEYHVRYLVGALRDGSPATLADYARWLQVVLTTRGMCTLHIDEHFAWLSRSLDAHQVRDAEPAHAYLAEARAALRYADGPGRTVQAAARELARRAAAAGLPRRELEQLVSFLGDAVAHGRPELFVAHARFLGARAERRAAVTATVTELRAAAGVVGDDAAATMARTALDDALAALAEVAA